MRKLIFLLLCMPVMAFAQTKNVVNANRIFPKQDKVDQFEKALAAHAQKYHKGDFFWRVFTIESGPDAGGYHITEGPSDWDAIDKRGNLGKEHQDDWNKNIAPLLTDRGSSTYSVYRDDLSTVKLTDFSNKIAINHIFYKPGYVEEAEEIIKKLKKTWEQSNQSVAVYEVSSSGPPQFTIVTRYKDGLKERTPGYRKPMKDRFTAANGEGSWAAYQQGLKSAVESSWSELLFMHPELGSK